MVRTYGEPKKGYLNFTLGNLWATQPIALLIWPPLIHTGTICIQYLRILLRTFIKKIFKCLMFNFVFLRESNFSEELKNNL